MNLKELALNLNLSPTTVSRVLSGQADRYRIGKETQAKVREAAQAAGVTVNQNARSLRLRVSKVIGMIVPDVSNPFFAGLVRRVEHAARAAGYSVLLADSDEREELEMELVRLMDSRGVDGMIIAPVSGYGKHLAQLGGRTKALVLVDRVPPTLHASSVVVDNFEAGRTGVNYLANAGHRAIACLQGLPDSYTDRERVRGYREAMRELGLSVRPEWLAGGQYSVQSGHEGVRAMLASPERPTAILALGNLLALGALGALHQSGLRVPDDVSLLSFDEQPWAASLQPPLTTLSQPTEEVAEKALGLLFNALGPDRAENLQRIVLPVAVVERRSVAWKRLKPVES